MDVIDSITDEIMYSIKAGGLIEDIDIDPATNAIYLVTKGPDAVRILDDVNNGRARSVSFLPYFHFFSDEKVVKSIYDE